MSKSKNYGFLSGFSKNFKKTRTHILRKKNTFKNSYLKSYRNTRDSIRNGYKTNYIARRDKIRNTYAKAKDGFVDRYDAITNVFAKNPALRPSIIAAIFFIFGLFIGLYVAPSYFTSATDGIELDTNTTKSAELSQIDKQEAELPSISSTRSTTYTTAKTAAYTAEPATVISIPANRIEISHKDSNGILYVPANNVGRYGTLYMGHTPGIFSDLHAARIGQKIVLGSNTYTVNSVNVGLEINGEYKVAGYSISNLASLPSGQIALISCYGSDYRTVVFASLD